MRLNCDHHVDSIMMFTFAPTSRQNAGSSLSLLEIHLSRCFIVRPDALSSIRFLLVHLLDQHLMHAALPYADSLSFSIVSFSINFIFTFLIKNQSKNVDFIENRLVIFRSIASKFFANFVPNYNHHCQTVIL